MKQFLLIAVVFLAWTVAQGQADSIKYANAITFIKHDKGIDKYRTRYFYKKAKRFRISQHVVFNYYPLRFFDKHLDTLGINPATVDSLCALAKDTVTIIPFAPKLSTDNKSDFILYFGKPINNLMFVVVEYDLSKGQDNRYYGICCHPLIILLVFDANNNVAKAHCSAPIID